jgi:carbonic anhydrase/acetyltransferase-like protein (isoleucine patch superfamily)
LWITELFIQFSTFIIFISPFLRHGPAHTHFLHILLPSMSVASSLARTLGCMLRETGQALERTGLRLMGSTVVDEELSRHRRLAPFGAARPVLAKSAYVAPNATVIGNVSLGEGASVWYGAVLRGDVNTIKVGSNAAIQDRAVVHVARIGGDFPTHIGSNVLVEAGATVHAATVEDGSLVGAGATVLDGAVVGKGSIVAAGALVTPGTKIPAGQLWSGAPAKYERAVSAAEQQQIVAAAAKLAALAQQHQAENEKSYDLRAAEETVRTAEAERHAEYVSKIGYSQ